MGLIHLDEISDLFTYGLLSDIAAPRPGEAVKKLANPEPLVAVILSHTFPSPRAHLIHLDDPLHNLDDSFVTSLHLDGGCQTRWPLISFAVNMRSANRAVCRAAM